MFALQELSLAGAAMGYMTVIGHALDIVVNAAGVMLLLHARRKVIEVTIWIIWCSVVSLVKRAEKMTYLL